MLMHFVGWCTIRLFNHCITQMQAPMVERLVWSRTNGFSRTGEM
jgi:hypothetical protein